MPSTTNNISIGTIFELVGPASPPAAIDDDQPAFDSLLQSPPASPPASPASLPSQAATPPPQAASAPQQTATGSRTADEKPASAYRTENSAERQKSSSPQSSGAGGSHDSTNDAPATSQQNSSPKTTARVPEKTSAKPGSDSSQDDLPASDQKPTAQSVVAESLAGLAAIAPVATGPAPTAVVTEAKESKETEPAETKAASPKQVPPSRAGTIQPAPVKSPLSDIDDKTSQETATPQTKAGAPDTTQVATATPNIVPAAATPPNKIQAAIPQQNTIEANTAAPESTIQAAAPPQGAPQGTPQAAAIAQKNQAAAAAQNKIEVGAPEESTGQRPATEAPKSGKTVSDAAVKALDQPAEAHDDSSEITADAKQPPPAPAHQQHPTQPSENQTVLTLDSAAAVPQTVDAATSAATSVPPPVAAIAAATPTVDARSRPTADPETSPLTNITLPQRSRLPEELLSQATTGPARRASVDIDATRLLARVARAFTAAQERDGEIRLRLSPPELGSLRLEVRIQDGAMVARLQTETDAARTAIIDNLPALRDRLFEQGVRIERFDVDLMQRQPGGTPDQSGNRQQPDLPASQVSALAPPRRKAEAPISGVPALPTIHSADGLNVVI